MKIWFIRHGESVANLEKVFSNQQAGHPLTAKGILQIQKAADALGENSFTKIFTSPVPRAVESAHIFAAKLNVEVEVCEELREFGVGILEGRSDDEAWRMFSDLWKKWVDQEEFDQKFEGGESLIEIRARMSRYLKRMAGEYGEQPVDVLAVSHGGLLHASLPFLADNLSIESCLKKPLSNTDRVILEWKNERWHCLEWAGISL